MNTIGITGASGFIGSHLVDYYARFSARLGFRVKILVRHSSQQQHFPHPNISLCYADLAKQENLSEFLEGLDFLIHSAGLVKSKNTEQLYTVNVGGTQHLIDQILKEKTNLKLLLNISSLAALGPSETAPNYEALQPVSEYGKSKLAAEKVILKYQNQIPICILRPGAVYGPRDTEAFELFKLAKQGFFVAPKFSYQQKLSFIYINDIIRACDCLIENHEKSRSKVYHADNGEIISFLELSQLFSEVFQRKVHFIKLPFKLLKAAEKLVYLFSQFTRKTPIFSKDKLHEMQQVSWCHGYNKLFEDFKWQPQYKNLSAFRYTLDWYRRQARL